MRWHGIALLLLLAPDAFGGDVITGTATVRERIAVPPEALFEAWLEDVSRADVSAEVLGPVHVDSPGNLPIRFHIPYDDVRIDPTHRYAVRGRISLDGRVMFVTDTNYPVLTRGAGSTVELLLKKVGDPPSRVSEKGRSGTGSKVPLPAHGLRMPATFRGDLPCADCEAVRYHLDLWPDQVFHLHREWVGRNLERDEVGRWRVDPSHQALILYGGAEMPLQFEIKGPNRLRLLDLDGKPIVSNLPYELISDGTLIPVDLNLLLAGEMVYMADAARFTECLTGRTYPIAMEGEFVKLQRAYQEAVSEPGGKLYVTFEGSITDHPKMEGAGTERAMVVRRFINVWPQERCERAMADSSLTNTYWRIVKFEDEPLHAVEGRREPHLVLRNEEGRHTAVATVGCNQLIEGYAIEGETVTFAKPVSTRMACPPPLDKLERKLSDALANTRRWRIQGPPLELSDEFGNPVSLLEAVYF